MTTTNAMIPAEESFTSRNIIDGCRKCRNLFQKRGNLIRYLEMKFPTNTVFQYCWQINDIQPQCLTNKSALFAILTGVERSELQARNAWKCGNLFQNVEICMFSIEISKFHQ